MRPVVYRRGVGSGPHSPAHVVVPRRLRWPPFLGLIVLGLIYWLLPERFSAVPPWVVLAAVVVMFVPINWAHVTGRQELLRWLALGLATGASLLVAASAALLVARLPGGEMPPKELLGVAGLIWTANVLAFAFWYWEIDGGGPAARHQTAYHSLDFVFPQKMATHADSDDWIPNFVDYVFLAFNTSTAFSPTDTLVLSRRAKGLMMTQSIISLVVIAMLAARAINTL